MRRSFTRLGTTVYKPTPHCALSQVGEEMVLLHLNNGTYYGLNEAGTYIWSLLTDGANLSLLLAHAQGRYGEEAHGLETDVQVFLDDLLEHDLIVAQPVNER